MKKTLLVASIVLVFLAGILYKDVNSDLHITASPELPGPSARIIPPAPKLGTQQSNAVISPSASPAKSNSRASAPTDAVWSTEEVFSEVRRLNSILRKAVADQIQKSEILADRPDYGVFFYDPIDAATALEIERGIEMIVKRAGPQAKDNATKVLTGIEGPLAEAKKFTVVQITQNPTGSIDVSTWRMSTSPPIAFDQFGRFHIDRNVNPGLEIIETSQAWGRSPEKLYGAVMPDKIKETMADAKQSALIK